MTSQTDMPANAATLEAQLHELEQANEVAQEIITAIGPTALPVLTEMLNHPDWLHRAAAAFFLGELGPSAEPAVPVLLQRLQDEDWRVRQRSGYSLEYYFNPQPWMWSGGLKACRGPVVPDQKPDQRAFATALLPCLNDAHPEVRVMAVGLLGRLGNLAKPAVPSLLEKLTDDDESVRYYAKAALVKIDPTLERQ
jgi:HEAT repeat protein